MTRTTLVSVRVDADMHEVLPNRMLAELIHKNLEQVGPPLDFVTLIPEAQKAPATIR